MPITINTIMLSGFVWGTLYIRPWAWEFGKADKGATKSWLSTDTSKMPSLKEEICSDTGI